MLRSVSKGQLLKGNTVRRPNGCSVMSLNSYLLGNQIKKSHGLGSNGRWLWEEAVCLFGTSAAQLPLRSSQEMQWCSPSILRQEPLPPQFPTPHADLWPCQPHSLSSHRAKQGNLFCKSEPQQKNSRPRHCFVRAHILVHRSRNSIRGSL